MSYTGENGGGAKTRARLAFPTELDLLGLLPETAPGECRQGDGQGERSEQPGQAGRQAGRWAA